MAIPFLAWAALYGSALPAIAGGIRYRRLNLPTKIVFVYCVITALQEFGLLLIAHVYHSNLSWANFFLGLEPVLLGTIYSIALGRGMQRRLVILIGILFVAFWVPDRLFYEVPGRLNESVGMWSRIAVVAMSIIVLHTIAHTTTSVLTDEPFFWFTTASLLNSAGAIFVLGTGNELFAMGMSYFQAAWNLNWSLDLTSYLLYTRGFFCKNNSAISFGR